MTGSDVVRAPRAAGEEPRIFPMHQTGYGQHPSALAQSHRYALRLNLPLSTYAVLSVVFAILALPLWWALFPAPLAVLFGRLGRRQVEDASHRGAAAARFGLVAGYIEIGLGVIVFIGLLIFATVQWYSSPYTTH